MASFVGGDTICDLVLSVRNVPECACNRPVGSTRGVDVPRYMVLYDVLFHVLTDDGYYNAGCRHRDQHLSVAVFAVAHLLRVSEPC